MAKAIKFVVIVEVDDDDDDDDDDNLDIMLGEMENIAALSDYNINDTYWVVVYGEEV